MKTKNQTCNDAKALDKMLNEFINKFYELAENVYGIGDVNDNENSINGYNYNVVMSVCDKATGKLARCLEAMSVCAAEAELVANER